jgi:uncharacterized membrane protein
MRRNLGPVARAASIAAGAALTGLAVNRRRPYGLGSTLGAALLLRGASGYCPVTDALDRRSDHDRDDTRTALGGSRGINLKASVTIARSPEEIYGFWRRLENLPLFIRGLEKVERLSDDVSEWTWRGPGRTTLRWRAEIINDIQPELIAWRSLADADLVSAGSVRFTPLVRGGTEVTVNMQAAPPGGKAGAAAAWLLGRGPSAELVEDLRRLKQLFEAGEIPTVEGEPSGARSAKFRAAKWVTA